MNPVLKDRISKVREALANSPIGVLAGHIPYGISRDAARENKWSSYFSFLEEVNGGRFGSVDIWSFDEYGSKQYLASEYTNGTKTWLVIGQLLYEPLVLEANTDQLYLFRENGSNSGEPLGTFDTFFSEVIFGKSYPRFIADGGLDEWWEILKVAGLIVVV